MDKEAPKNAAPFRFLNPREFAALSQQERIDYLIKAVEAMNAGRSIDSSPAEKAPGKGH